MMIKKPNVLKTAMATTLLAAAATAFSPAASAAVNVDIGIAPPAPLVEVVPAPRPGYLWTPGYWDYRGHRHVWVRGAWARERAGYVYAHPEWVQRGDRWHFERGGWHR